MWLALPFLGYDDPQLAMSFVNAVGFLAEQERIHAAVVDPRVPAVRQWIVDHCHRMVESLGLDGLKLDFLDRFAQVWDGTEDSSQGRDVATVGAAVVKLMDELEHRLHGSWPTHANRISSALHWSRAASLRESIAGHGLPQRPCRESSTHCRYAFARWACHRPRRHGDLAS